jgi:predicted GNAT superfamily acetyltransferase
VSDSLPQRIQLHLVLPYKFEPRGDKRVRAYLDRGYRIVDLQRITDREALVTLDLRPAS